MTDVQQIGQLADAVLLQVMLLTVGAMLSTVALVVSPTETALPALSVAVTVTLRLVASMLPAAMM